MSPNPLDSKRTANRLLLLICIAFLLCSAFVPPLLPQDNPALFTLLVTFIAEGVLFLPAWVFIRTHGGAAAFGLRMPKAPKQLLWALGLGVSGFLLATGINSLMQAIWLVLDVQTLDTAGMAYLGGGWNILAAFFSIVLIPVVAEETLFRGAMLHAWLPQNRTRAVWRAALLFALLHMNPMSLPAYLVLGLLMASITVLSGSIVPAMLVHGVNNLFVLLITYLSPEAFVAEAEMVMQPGDFLLAAALYILLGALLGRACHRRFRTSVAQREATRRLFRLPDMFAGRDSIFLPPEPEEDEQGEEAPDSPAAAPAAPPPAEEPLPTGMAAAADITTNTAPGPEADAPPQKRPRLRLQGTGRGALIATYLLLALANIFVFLAASGMLGGIA